MRISDVQTGGVSGSQLDKAQGANPAATEGAKANQTGQGGGGDQVQLSGMAFRLVNVLEADAPARASRLASLAAQIRSGSYNPDASAVSRSLVEESMAQGA
jgi:anti-sigma28 factor (negative regulator of flagellin synthesis)